VVRFFILFLISVFAGASASAADCYTLLTQLRFQRFAHENLGDDTPVILTAAGTKIPIARAFEKEGLLYSDIAEWFPSAKPEAAQKLVARLAAEKSGDQTAALTRWLNLYSKKYREKGVPMPPKKWEALSLDERLAFILREPDFFRLISVRGREDLFYDGILKFDDLAITEATPKLLTVGDDLGSYEVRSNGGSTDRTFYFGSRKQVEDFLEGKVGHQHKVHAWPEDPSARRLMAPKYIELLDAGTWYLYWRQMKRNPSEVESVLTHPYLGVYTRWWLERLYHSVVEAKPKTFKNKFRMIGARSLKPDPGIPEQKDQLAVPDFELRSGNKSDNRDFVEDMIEARIASGDYSGLRDFRDYNFDPTAPISAHAYKWLNREDIEVLEQLEKLLPQMKYSSSPMAHNHFRTKVIAPLLPWESRLNIAYKRDLLEHQQELYAKNLVKIARQYIEDIKLWRKKSGKKGVQPKGPPSEEVLEAREQAIEQIEKAAYRFADRVRLDLDFERYLAPKPTELPDLTVEPSGPVDVNSIDLGIEFSFRFPTEVKISSAEIAEREIVRTIEALRTELGGGTIERLSDGGHGHGASIRYKYTDPYDRVWRAEWDGVQREYLKGKLVNPHGGHVEVPSPKYSPQDPLRDVSPVYDAARSGGQRPKRSAGGGHMNVDLSPILKLPAEKGVRMILNLIAYFESNREMITFLWQHPRRGHAARPVDTVPDFGAKIAAFQGDWKDLARFLYEQRYFNPYVGRKPRYVEMDVTGLMHSAVPAEYKKGTLDIKNPNSKWFPDFGKGKDRIEFRLFDAMPDEYFAALQIKYTRALLNRAFNSKEPIRLITEDQEIKALWRKDPQEFMKAAEAHLRDLGLDPVEFRPLLQDSFEQQQTEPSPRKPLKRYRKFLPAAS
jgi:hypothetical protein